MNHDASPEDDAAATGTPCEPARRRLLPAPAEPKRSLPQEQLHRPAL